MADGRPDMRWPAKGSPVCRFHGARLPNVRHAALVRQENAKARAALAKMGQAAPIEHPVYEWLSLAAEEKAFSAFLREQVLALEDYHTVDSLGTERVKVLVELYEHSLERRSRSLEGLARLELETKALRMRTEESADMMKAIIVALRRAGADDAFVSTFRSELAAVLRLSHGDPPGGIAARVSAEAGD